ncbi:MAG: penicillin-binding protein 1A [Rhodospirillaceae bacterium]|nr:penicillin-binding protein 1A [Rhodospirillaceae bacterium]
MGRFLTWVLSSLALLTVAVAVAVIAVVVHYSSTLPDHSQLANYEPRVTSRLYTSDGQLLAQFATENRLYVPIDAIPDHVAQAFVSAEDQHFYEHDGIDLLGIARAAWNNLMNLGTGQRPEGASTITQQVVRNLFLSNDPSFHRKLQEILLALRIEDTLTKDQILELYLNEIYLGRNSFGVAAAALNYFNCSLPELTLSQAAFLAGLPKAPNNYQPDRNYEAAIERRNYVLRRMLEDGAITQAEADAAMAEPLVLAERERPFTFDADYFAEEVRRQLQARYGDDALYGGGLAVRSTLDPTYQGLAETALRDGLIAYDRRHGWRGPVDRLETFDDWPGQLSALEVPAGAGDWRLAAVLEVGDRVASIGLADGSRGEIPFDELSWARPWLENQQVGAAPQRVGDVLELGDVVLVSALGGGTAASSEADADAPPARYRLEQIPEIQGALVVMDPHTGRVLAMAGGYDYDMSEFNRATQAVRQPGSAFKPFVYLAALEAGYTPSTIVLDSPISVDIDDGRQWSPDNYGHDFLGPQPLRIGLERSRNIMTVRLILSVGLERVREIAQRFGIYDDMPLLYSMALGAGETTPLNLTAAYAMLANGGLAIEPTLIDRIQDRTGRTIYRHDERPCLGCVAPAWYGEVAPEIPDNRQRIADPVSVYQVVSMLEGVVQRGTATRLQSLGFPVAGKTGTTNDAHDAWFVGFTPDLVAGVFVGFDQPRTLGHESGSSAAAPIFGEFMAAAMEGREVPPFRIPPNVRLVQINPSTGQPASEGATIWEAFRPGTEPTRQTLEDWSDPLLFGDIPFNAIPFGDIDLSPTEIIGTDDGLGGSINRVRIGDPVAPGSNLGTGGLY